ncbi:S-adenosyl-L-methionine-dependent methyltransferase [Trametes versicolor FP-101664 SS1]|uniref:S-adenosyl-L-methionine-dependent methyltransferase n=1 Tax=Trametes versicolor (strain FP-101664) TaxID=717944 RepID=UPI0004621A2E|nr:S-adenosyl-L-methionine-dependent methyltransferase [Trametes versicolor FP-101664 SS1]EIW62507.1 S-adenosyl-L-methionine-dependent methyltransferase [Trametes versicolor FP-101664 SS1]
MATFATLRALHTLLGDALAEIERVYHAPPAGGGPVDYPSLDVPVYKDSAPSGNTRAAEDLTSDPTVVTAANTIVAACGQIAATLHKPFFQLCEANMGEIITSCIGFAEATHTVEILRAAGGEGLHVHDIARRINDLRRAVDANIAPLDPGKLGHILRLLATHHWFREVRPDVFANNRLSAQVDSGKTPEELRAVPEKKYDDTDGVAALVAMKTDEFCKTATHLTDHLLPERARTLATRTLLDPARSTAPAATVRYQTPFNLAFRTELGYFQWLELPENARRMTNFGRAMVAARAWEVAENIIDAFPWKDLPEDAVVVDVGGGIGSTSMVLANAYSHLRFVVQDRPIVVAVAPSLCDKLNAGLIASGRVSFMAQDFFDPQPASLDVPGVGTVSAPAVYLIRGCVHNWPDSASSRRMLGLLRSRAALTTQLLIVDTVLPYACPDSTSDPTSEPIPGALCTLVPDGSPLLANLGRTHASLYQLDICMMTLLDAKERTIREVAALAREAGWEVTGTTRGAGSLWGYTAARPI